MRYFIFLILFSYYQMASAQKEAYASDVQTIEALTKAYYDCISGPIGQIRDFDRLRNLFHPNATFTYSFWSEEAGKNELMQFDLEDYIEKLDYLDKKGFYEEELSSATHEFGGMVNVISSYRFWMEDKTAEGRGITNYHYYFDGDRYWILSMYWQMESDQYPIPEHLLRDQKNWNK